jgi:tetratricopeptide (TPR) repeat protein
VISIRTTLLVVEGKAQEAIPLQERLVRAGGPGRPVALNNLAYLYRVVGRTQDARRVLEQLVEDGNAHPDVWFNLAEVERREGRWEEALTAFERALDLNPRDPRFSIRLEQVRFEYARSLARVNRRIEAIDQLQIVVRRTGDLELRRTAEIELKRLQGPAASSGTGGSR